jgi:hypothetical protein
MIIIQKKRRTYTEDHREAQRTTEKIVLIILYTSVPK